MIGTLLDLGLKTLISDKIRRNEKVNTYLSQEFYKLIEESSPKEGIGAHLPSVNRKERMDRIIDGLNQVISNKE